MEHKQKLGFIGAGNMATALIKGLLENGRYGPKDLLASDSSDTALSKISADFGVSGYASNSELVGESGVVVLSVKPQIIRDVLEKVKGRLRADHLLISIAAGIPLSMIGDIIPQDIPLIRVMPNTPALVQQGISALAAGPSASPAHMHTAKGIFAAVGETVEVSEEMMDAVTAVSGSGPGYVFYLMEGMVDAAVATGLDPQTAIRLVIQTFLGAAHLAKTSEDSLSRLREKVTSPGGTTAAGLDMFEKLGMKRAIQKGVDAAYRRSMELGKPD
ncbi:MAG: pyrroline-5-carboxylate reductase [Thermodesulfobacteriota bacterium]